VRGRGCRGYLEAEQGEWCEAVRDGQKGGVGKGGVGKGGVGKGGVGMVVDA